MDKISLENAIRNTAEDLIKNLARKEDEDIKRLDEAYAAEMDDFRNRIHAQTDDRIRLETSRIENRANLELKKLKIRSIEAFISRAFEEAVKTIRDNPLYKRFLLAAIVDVVGRIPTGAEVRLKREDLTFEGEVREALKAAAVIKDIVIVEDNRIKWGGCIVIDVPGGRIFDSTIERIYFRKSSLIRQEAMSLLGDFS